MKELEEVEKKKAIIMLESLLRKIKNGKLKANLSGVWPAGTSGSYIFRVDVEEVNPEDSR